MVEREREHINEFDTDTLQLLLLAAMFVEEHINANAVQAAMEYARRLIALNQDVPVWVSSIQGVTEDCDRAEAAAWAAREFCGSFLEEG